MATTTQTPASQQQESKEQTGAQERRLARRGMYDPLAFSLFPLDFLPTPFSMNPLALLRRMTEEIDRTSGARGDQMVAPWAPTVEVSTSNGNCVVRAELPGLKPEEVKVEVVDNALVIEGERKFQQEKSGSHRTERMYGRFYRIIQLPEGANGEQASAKFQDGILEVTIPVKEPQSNRRAIHIDTGASGPSQQSGQQGSHQG